MYDRKKIRSAQNVTDVSFFVVRYGLGTLETERSSMNHIVDMINIEMFTIDEYPILRDDRTWVI